MVDSQMVVQNGDGIPWEEESVKKIGKKVQ